MLLLLDKMCNRLVASMSISDGRRCLFLCAWGEDRATTCSYVFFHHFTRFWQVTKIYVLIHQVKFYYISVNGPLTYKPPMKFLNSSRMRIAGRKLSGTSKLFQSTDKVWGNNTIIRKLPIFKGKLQLTVGKSVRLTSKKSAATTLIFAWLTCSITPFS